jgi:hypothetical protein
VFENALTVPKDQVEVDARATVGVGLIDLRFGATPTTELSVEVGGVAASPFTPELAVGIKQVLVRTPRFRFAVDASIRDAFVQQDNFEPTGGGGVATPPTDECCNTTTTSQPIAALGVVATGCVDGACVLRVTAGAQYWIAFGEGGGSVEVAWFDAELGNPHFRVAAEGMLGFSGDGDDGSGPAQMLTIGLRGGWRHLQLEGGAAIVNGGGGGDSATLPYFGIAGRL